MKKFIRRLCGGLTAVVALWAIGLILRNDAATAAQVERSADKTPTGVDHEIPFSLAREVVSNENDRLPILPTHPMVGGQSKLLIRVVDQEGRPVVSGEIEYFFGDTMTPESDPSGTAKGLSLAGVQTIIELPAEARHCLLRVRTADGGWGSHRQFNLRRTSEGAWVSDDTPVSHTLTVVVHSSTSRSAQIYGDVYVDGARAIPDNLRIILEQEPFRYPRTEGEFAEQRDQLAVIEHEDRRFFFDSPRGSIDGLWVTSSETKPVWLPLDNDDVGHQVDLRLESGASLSFSMRHRVTGRASPGCYALVISTPGEPRPDNSVLNRTYAIEARTSTDGLLVAEGLPETGRLGIGFCNRTNTDPYLLFESIPRLLERAGPIVVEVPEEGFQLGVVWGEVPQWGRDLALHWSSELDSRHHSRGLGRPGSMWEVRLAAGSYSAWISESSEGLLFRKSTVLSVEVVAGGSVGPITFQDLAPGCIIDWRDPPRGTLSVNATDVYGSVAAFGPETSEAGQLELPLLFEGDVAFEAKPTPGAVIRHRIAIQGANPRLVTYDLWGRSAPRIEWRGLERSVDIPSSSVLLLLALPGQGIDVMAIAPLGPDATHVVGLPPGEYFYNLHAPNVGAFVCGVATHRKGSPELELDWPTHRIALSELGGEPLKGYEVTSVNGVDLVSRVPQGMRQFVLPEDVISDDSSAHVLVPQGSTWAPR